MTRWGMQRTFWIGAAAILVVAALVGIFAVIKGNFSDTDGRILGTLAAMLFTGGGLLAGLTVLEREIARPLGWAVVGMSPVCLVLLLLPIWDVTFDGGSDFWKPAWSAVIALIAGLIATTGLVLARRDALLRLAAATGWLGGLSAAMSIAAIWIETGEEGLVKAIVALWILTALGFFLVPVLQRWSSVGEETATRVLAVLDDVELVASRTTIAGVQVTDRLAEGERLFLRHRR